MADTAQQLQAWVRERFRLPPQAVVMVDERTGSVPGGPPRETVIVFWGDTQLTTRHHYRVFKPLADVQPDDLPPWWMKDALAFPPDWACGCC